METYKVQVKVEVEAQTKAEAIVRVSSRLVNPVSSGIDIKSIDATDLEAHND